MALFAMPPNLTSGVALYKHVCPFRSLSSVVPQQTIVLGMPTTCDFIKNGCLCCIGMLGRSPHPTSTWDADLMDSRCLSIELPITLPKISLVQQSLRCLHDLLALDQQGESCVDQNECTGLLLLKDSYLVNASLAPSSSQPVYSLSSGAASSC